MVEASGLSSDKAQSFTFQRKELAVTVVGVYELPMIVPGPLRPRPVPAGGLDESRSPACISSRH